MSNQKILNGVKVIELSTFVAAPGCARIMADWGADVIKIEPLMGDVWRLVGATLGMPTSVEENPNFDNENANKKGLALNLKSAEGQEILEKLIKESDILITNYREDALQKLNLTYEEVAAKCPGIIYGQVLGFGEKGPDKDRPGYDITAYLARTGVMCDLGEPEAPPLNLISSFGDHQAATNLVAGVCGALYKKQATGKGEKVTVSLYHTAIYALGTMLTSTQYGICKYPYSRKSPLSPISNTYQCKDGRWLVLVNPDIDRQWSVLCRAVGREDLANSEKYKGLRNVLKHKEEIVEILDKEFIKRDREEWAKVLTEADISFEKVQHWHEVLKDEQAWANDYFIKAKYSNGNEAILPTTPVKFKEMGTPEFKVAPKLGEDTAEILRDLGYSDEYIEEIRSKKVVR